MGKKKETTVVNQQTTPKATPEEEELNKLRLQQFKDFAPAQNLINQLGGQLTAALLGGQQLPGQLGQLTSGMSQLGQLQAGQIDPNEGALGPQATSDIVQESLRDIRPGFQQSGLLDSGTRASIEARTAGDIRRNVAESDLERRLGIRQFNIGGQLGADQFNLNAQRARQSFNQNQLMQLLGMSLGAPAQIQNPQLQQQQLLSQSLGGLRSQQTTGTSTTKGMNPFLQSFQQGFGSDLGQGFGQLLIQ